MKEKQTLRKRILFITPLPPPVHGSAMMSQYIRDSRLINEAFDCDFVNLSTSRRMDEIGRKPLLKLVRFAGAFLKVLGKLISHRYDLCYLAITCHGLGFLKDAPFVLLCKGFGRKIVIHQHNKGMSSCVDRWPYRWLLPWVYRHTKVILLSWRLYPDIQQVVSREQILICPNGIPESSSPVAYEKEAHAVPRLLFLSNLLVSKGVLVLLDALQLLKEKGYSFVCDFVGGETAEIDARRFQEEVEKRGLNRIALYRGKQYGKDKEHFFQQADLFIQPTLNDCFPLVQLEAMEYRLPVISTEEGGIPDLVRQDENGLLVEKNNPVSLAQGVGRLLDDAALREKMGEAGYRLFKAHYTQQAFEACLKDCLTHINHLGGGKLTLCRYLGRKVGSEKEEIFQQADIFVFPTYYDNECFPVVLLEAMQHRLPIVTTDEGGIADIVQDGVNGFVCARQDASAVAQQLTLLLTDSSLREQMGEAGFHTYLKHFTIQEFESKMRDGLQKSLGS